MQKWFVSYGLTVLLCMGWVSSGHAYTVGIGALFGKDVQIVEIENVLREAYRRIGMQIDFEYYPMLRDMEFSNSGKIDASAARGTDAIAQYSSLRIVDVPLAVADYIFYISDKKLKNAPWSDFVFKKIVIVNGALITEKIMNEHNISPYKVVDIESAVNMVVHRRMDALFSLDALNLHAYRKKGVTLYKSGVVAKRPLYHIVNVKNANVIEPLSQALCEMLKEGVTNQLMGRFASMAPHYEDVCTPKRPALPEAIVQTDTRGVL